MNKTTILRRLVKEARWHYRQSPSAMQRPEREFIREYVERRIDYETKREAEKEEVCIGGRRWNQL